MLEKLPFFKSKDEDDAQMGPALTERLERVLKEKQDIRAMREGRVPIQTTEDFTRSVGDRKQRGNELSQQELENIRKNGEQNTAALNKVVEGIQAVADAVNQQNMSPVVNVATPPSATAPVVDRVGLVRKNNL